MKVKKRSANISLILISIIISLVLVEVVFRMMIFSDNDVFKPLQKPGDYADFFSEDLYWKLYYRWDGKFEPPSCVHEELGWIRDFSRYSLVHWDMKHYQSKRPVLLYGDSYAACSRPTAICFEEILNIDPDFSNENHLYNYGVGGYGLDQIYMLFDKTVGKYEDPLIVFSLFVHDMDRTWLTLRTGQKPYFRMENDSLVLKGVPLEKDAKSFFDEHSARPFSFLVRKFLFSKQNFLGSTITKRLLGLDEIEKEKIKINKAILQKTLDHLRNKKMDFVFLVFHILKYDENNFGTGADKDWRNVLLKDFFKTNDVPYIWSKEVILEDSLYQTFDVHNYMIPDDGHPTTHLNQLITNEIKKYVSANPANLGSRIYADSVRIENIQSDSLNWIDLNDKAATFTDYDFEYFKEYIFSLEKAIRKNTTFMDHLKMTAKEKDIDLDTAVRQFAIWLIYDMEHDCH